MILCCSLFVAGLSCVSVLRHEDIVQRMPRSEAAEIEALVAEVAQSICPGVICQARFRRGDRCVQQQWQLLCSAWKKSAPA